MLRLTKTLDLIPKTVDSSVSKKNRSKSDFSCSIQNKFVPLQSQYIQQIRTLYIVEYEQKGEDRAKYGEKLIQNLSKQLGAKKFSATTLKIYRQFYVTYPQLSSPIAQFLTKHLAIGQSATD